MRPTLKTRRRSQRGQTAVIALLVLLLLSFIGALFITIIARNLKAQGRSHRTLNADYYAEAGLRYADAQLTTSLDGADWRPPLQYQVTAAFQPKDTVGLKRYQAFTTPNPPQLPPVVTQDPDRAYLQQGFARYNTQNGRFLLRVTYDPINQSSQDNPTARYLKIESVGREGTVDPTDPTTFQNQPVTRLAATLVAYKPIGITDYARFETNIDKRSDIANLGVPSIVKNNNILTPGVFDFDSPSAVVPPQLFLTQYPILVTYGSPDAYLNNGGGRPHGEPERRAGKLRWNDLHAVHHATRRLHLCPRRRLDPGEHEPAPVRREYRLLEPELEHDPARRYRSRGQPPAGQLHPERLTDDRPAGLARRPDHRQRASRPEPIPPAMTRPTSAHRAGQCATAAAAAMPATPPVTPATWPALTRP